jgi:hypothetical protein
MMEMFPSLENFLMLCELEKNLLGPPDTGCLFHLSLHFLAMPTRSESILDHIADYL